MSVVPDNPNPYQAPTETSTMPQSDVSQSGELAARSTRFVAALIDGILMMVLLIPIYFATSFIQHTQQGTVTAVESFLMMVVSMGVFLLINGYLLVKRGQSVGKLLFKIQIVDQQTDRLLPFFRVIVLRHWWMLPVSIVVAIIPGTADDMIVNLLSLIDVLMIFGAAHLCLHDRIAGSKVVLYHPDRTSVAP